MTWRTVVSAPQGGPVFTHVFTGDTVKALLDEIKEALDLEQADSVVISFMRVKP